MLYTKHLQQSSGYLILLLQETAKEINDLEDEF